MLMKMKYNNTETVWMKDNFSKNKFKYITNYIKGLFENICFDKKEKTFICSSEHEINSIERILENKSYSKKNRQK